MTNEFKVWLENVARANHTSAELVLQQWKQYCANCAAFDQSPAQYEFLQWYRLEAPWLELELFEL